MSSSFTIGIDELDSYEHLTRFVSTVAGAFFSLTTTALTSCMG